MKSKLIGMCAALGLLSSSVAVVQASSLTSDVIAGSYSFPCASCIDTGDFSYFFNPFVVGSGVETTLLIGNPVSFSAWSVDFSSNSVTLTMLPAPLPTASYTADPFNGPVFTVLSGNSFGSITSVVANNPDCVPCNSITASILGDSLLINWQGAGGSVGDTVTIGFSGGDPVSQVSQAPLPAALPLFATGLGAMGLLGWWRKRKIQRSPA